MSALATADTRVTKFCNLVNQGMQAWVIAGELLNEMVRDDPLVIGRIVRDNPHLNRAILESFQRIGRREVLPILIVDGSPGARLLAGLAYQDQERVYAQGVKVIKQTISGPVERKCHVSELTAGEAKRVFDLDRIRTVGEQRDMLKRTTGNHFAPRDREPDRVIIERAAIEPEVTLDAPLQALEKALNSAHLALMQSRDALGKIKEGHPLDDQISLALGAVGRLRYALNDGQIRA